MRKKDPICSYTNSYSIRKKLRKIDFQFWRYFLKMVGIGVIGIITISVLGQDRVSPQITDFAKAQKASADNNKEGAEVVYEAGDYEFLPTELPFDELTPERSEALQMKRVMHVVIFVTPEAKAYAEAQGTDMIAQVKKTTNGFEEFMKNCGGDLKCEIQTEIKVIPNDVFQDVNGNTGPTVRDFVNTGLTEGSWMDEALDQLTSNNNISRLVFPIVVVENLPSAAHTNWGKPGFPMNAGTLFSRPLKTHDYVDNQLVNIFLACLNLQANVYLS